MMSFWDLSDGASAATTGTEYEIEGGNMSPIPAESSVLAMPDEVKWDRKDTGERFIALRWTVLSPDEYKNRKIFHKLWVTDLDPQAKDNAKAVAKRDKARKMLAAIDANAGGKLAMKAGEPTDDDLAMALLNKPMIVKVMIWSMRNNQTGEMMEGNWVAAVSPKAKGIDVKPATARPQTKQGGGRADLDGEIPF
jgi:hypothetical protein